MTSDRIEPLPTRAEPALNAPATAAARYGSPAAMVFWITVASVALFLFPNVIGATEALTARFSVDDSFYYFQMAWQTAQSGFVTFDGVHAANKASSGPPTLRRIHLGKG